MAEALYRKYRPQIFEDVVGQEPIERTLKNAVDQDKVSHAYLFTGPRGTGKTTTARLLAKALLCQEGPTSEPDGTCEDCRMIARGEHPDVYELDAASRTGVENVREEIIGRVQFAPTRGRYKVYIIDEVHMLSTAAFNALLKTLEEPPSHVVFILCTTDPQKVPETIHSRCQRFDFRRIPAEKIISRLGAICVSEDVEFEGEALDLIAYRAEGGMRNALTSLEQLIAFGEGKVTRAVAESMLGSLDSSHLAEIVELVGKRDAAGCFRWIADYVETGADLAQFTRDFTDHMRHMYVLSLVGDEALIDLGDAQRRELASELPLYGTDRLARVLDVLGSLATELKSSTNPRLSFEIALTRLVRPESDLTLESLAERVEALEMELVCLKANGVPQRPAAEVSPAQPVATQAPAREAAVKQAAREAAVTQTPTRETAAAQGSQGQRQMPASQAAQSASVAQDTRATSSAVAQPRHAQPEAKAGGEDTVAAATSATAAAGGLPESLVESLRNPATLQRLWQGALTSLKKYKASFGVLFLNTKAVFTENPQSFSIRFPAENDFAFKAVQKSEVLEALEQALIQAFGVPIPYHLEQAGKADAPAFSGFETSAPVNNAAEPAPAAPAVPEFVPAAASPQEEPPFDDGSVSTGASTLVEIDTSLPDYDDDVPVDLYDSFEEPEPEIDDFPGAGAANHNFEQPAVSAPHTFEAPAPASASKQQQPSAPAAADDEAADLNAMLAFGFGEGLTFEEVD